ncbi:MAG: flagellar M-ring protein FliF [Burkholderiales bacterium]|nr:flagellar M-ring protein FliF [Burkholderiales bacterium]
MPLFHQLWERLDRPARFGLAACLAVLLIVTVSLGVWLLRPDYQVLFGDLAQADAAAMTAELDRMKIPYRLDNGGNTILVPAEQVYKTRLKLVGRDLPLHGTVGFELFNNTDIGMTEFAQKVNYQRAIQGELTRTILAIEEIQSARVHLAIPEQTLFKKTSDAAKASVSIGLKRGKTLKPTQIQGIQRLVAASVPNVREEDVTVIDQHGVALTRAAAGNDEEGASPANLDNKAALEGYLTRKVVDVLDRTFGAGQSIASVDVVFNHDHTKVTTENVLGSSGGENGDVPTGVIVHERESSHDAPSDTPGAAHASGGESSSHDVDYQVGRRVEQVVSGPGTVSKINVAVVVKQTMDAAQIERIRDLVAMAAGINKARGDGIAVYSVNQFASAGGVGTPLATTGASAAAALPTPDAVNLDMEEPAPTAPSKPSRFNPPLLVAAMAILGFVLIIWRGKRPTQPTTLDAAQREQLLARLRGWLNEARTQSGDQA